MQYIKISLNDIRKTSLFKILVLTSFYINQMSYGGYSVVDTVRGLPGYATEMAKGVLSVVIQTQGFLGFIDKCWVILSRVKMIILFGTLLAALITWIVAKLQKDGGEKFGTNIKKGAQQLAQRAIGVRK